MHWIWIIFMAFAVSLLLTGLIIPQVLLIAFRRKLFDKPDGRKIHNGSIPRLGGTTFFPAVICSVTLTLGVFINIDDTFTISADVADVEPLLFLICSVTLLYLVGLADDLVGVRYRAKFLVQIACALLTLISGVAISNLYGLLWIDELPRILSWLLTAFMIVYVVNAINLIDGIDGLASGLASIALAFYSWIFYLEGEFLDSMVALATCGTLLSFFYYNVFGNPEKRRKIFMGDTGSLTVGMVIAYFSIVLTDRPAPMALENANPVLIAYSPMLIPLLDVVRVCIRRVRCQRNPFLPDRSHIHHKLLALGFSAHKALSIILLSSILLIVFNVLLSEAVDPNLLLMFDIVIWTLLNMLITTRIKARERRLGKRLYE